MICYGLNIFDYIKDKINWLREKVFDFLLENFSHESFN
jgi:hypothetical protein